MPIQDVNALLAQPWPNLAAQWADQVNEGLRNSQIATDSGPGGTIHYDARIEWDDDLEVVTDLTAVPGYARMDASGLRFAAPLDANASYSMRADGTLSGHIKVSGSACKLADQTLTHEPQTIALTGLRLVVDAALDSSDPDRPKLKSVNLAPNALLTLTGYVAATLKLSQLEPVVTRSGPNAGARSWQVTVSDVRIKAVRNARLSGTLTLTLEPTVTLDFRGTLRFGQIGIPFNGHKIVSLPTPLADVLALLGREGLPRDWGQNPPRPAGDREFPAAGQRTGAVHAGPRPVRHGLRFCLRPELHPLAAVSTVRPDAAQSHRLRGRGRFGHLDRAFSGRRSVPLRGDDRKRPSGGRSTNRSTA